MYGYGAKTRSHMIYHVIKGDWGRFPNKHAVGYYWPSAHCLPLYLSAPKMVHQNVPMKKASRAFWAHNPEYGLLGKHPQAPFDRMDEPCGCAFFQNAWVNEAYFPWSFPAPCSNSIV
jgi:hypothetical protein